MPLLVRVPDLRNGYLTVRDAILADGARKAPREQRTIESRDVTIVLEDPTDALPLGINRRLNIKIGMLEAAQLIAGLRAPATTIDRVAPHMAEFAAEPDGSYWGAYGARIGTQMLHVERKLLNDRDTRQAVVTLWHPPLDNEDGHRDYPCTVALMFSIDNDKLVMGTRMRSNDFWLGLAFDMFQFTQLQLTLAAALGIEAGAYHHNAWSLHIYERDLEAISRLQQTEDIRGFRFMGIGRDGQDMVSRLGRAVALVRGRPLADPTPTEKAYADALA